MKEKAEDLPSYEPKFERAAAPTEPLLVRAAKREKQREEIRRSHVFRSVRRSWGSAINTHVKWFLKTGYIQRTSKEESQRRLLTTKLGKKRISSTRVALWVFDLNRHADLELMEAYQETADDLHLSQEQVRRCFKRHREVLELHEFLFKLR